MHAKECDCESNANVAEVFALVILRYFCKYFVRNDLVSSRLQMFFNMILSSGGQLLLFQTESTT